MPTAYDMPQMPDTKPGLYYVTVVRNGSEWRPLLGPFENDHAGALAMVEQAKSLACQLDPRAHWYAYGTARIDAQECPPTGLLNGKL